MWPIGIQLVKTECVYFSSLVFIVYLCPADLLLLLVLPLLLLVLVVVNKGHEPTINE